MKPHRGIAVLGAMLLVACSATGPVPMTVESERFPAISIECAGDPGLTEATCREWAEHLLPTGPEGTAKLVLTYRSGNARCAADYFAVDARLLMTAAAQCPAL